MTGKVTVRKAHSSGIVLTDHDASVVKGMLLRGDRQQDIAAWFGVNGGRISEINTGDEFWWVDAAPDEYLPPQGPYHVGQLFGQIELLRAIATASNDN